MDVVQILLLTLAAPVTYLLLFALMRLESRLPGAGEDTGGLPQAPVAGPGPTWVIAVPSPPLR